MCPVLEDGSTTGMHLVGVIRVIEDQITTLRPYNARYTGDHRSIFRKRYTEMITRVSLDMSAFDPSAHALFVTVGHPRPGREGNGMAGMPAGSRRQPVFGRLPALGEKWPALAAAGWRACRCDRAGSRGCGRDG